jgi:histidinol-phosphate aminotransferase
LTLSRRSFVRSLGAGGAGVLGWPLAARADAALVSARGHEALANGDAIDAAPTGVRLDSKENPRGPSREALAALRSALGDGGRYPRAATDELRHGIAGAFGITSEQVALGCGSTEILRSAVLAFTSPTRALVVGAPTFETPGRTADMLGVPVRAVPVDRAMGLDLDAMLDAARDAGLVFLCNPNNPTGTVHGAADVREFVARVRRDSPRTVILIDEAYHEYVDDPSYASAMPLAIEDSHVIVSRTFSKVFGLAGLRVGYAVGRAEPIAALERWRLANDVNALGAAAALVSLPSLATMREHIARERVLNREAKRYTTGALEAMGHAVVPSNANFILVDVGREAKAFQEACRTRGVLVGRPFPPLTTHARISIGTLPEMQRACEVFGDVLRAT